MAIAVSGVRLALAAKIAALAGFSEARVPFEAFGRTANSVAHLRFCVATSRTTRGASRQRKNSPVAVTTQAIIRFAYRLRPRSAYPADYDSATDTEETVIFAVLNGDFLASAPEIAIRYDESARTLTDSGEFLIVDVSLSIDHYLTS